MARKAGYSTLALDNLSRGDPRTLLHSDFIKGDLEDEELLAALFKERRIDAVVHFAAFIDVGESCRHPALYYRNNLIATVRLLDTMRKHGVDKILFSSSAAIFGNPQTALVGEEHPCLPINPYGHSKQMIESLLHDYHAAYGLNFCCLRYFNAAGGDPEGVIKYYQPKPTNLIPLIFRSLKPAASPLTLFGTDYPTRDGTCIRDYIHLEDLGNAHLLALEKLCNGNRTSACYNLGNGAGYSVREVIRATEQLLGKRIHVLEGPRREGDPPILVADAAKAQRELGWKPSYSSLETIIQHAWAAL